MWAACRLPVYYLEHEWGGGAREVETLQQLSLHVVFAAVALDHHRLRRTLERQPGIIRAGKSTQFMYGTCVKKKEKVIKKIATQVEVKVLEKN